MHQSESQIFGKVFSTVATTAFFVERSRYQEIRKDYIFFLFSNIAIQIPYDSRIFRLHVSGSLDRRAQRSL